MGVSKHYGKCTIGVIVAWKIKVRISLLILQFFFKYVSCESTTLKCIIKSVKRPFKTLFHGKKVWKVNTFVQTYTDWLDSQSGNCPSFCISLYLSQHSSVSMSGLDKSISIQKSVPSVLFNQRSLWRHSQNYKQDLWKLAKTTSTSRSGGPQWICSPSLASPTLGNYHERIHPCTLTFKGSQQ